MKIYRHIWILTLTLLGCVEPIEIDTNVRSTVDIKDILVVEGTLTNQLKRHSVVLRRGNTFADDSLIDIENANVSVLDNLGNVFSFFENQPGTYLSESLFQALPENEYQLRIEVAGKVYNSEKVGLPPPGAIDRVFAQRLINNSGLEGIGIFVDAVVALNEPPLLRFTYEETYKIIAPLWTPLDMAVLDRNPPYVFGLVPKEEEKRVCFGSQASNNIIQNEGVTLIGNRVENVLVRFIPRDDFIISHRYSILVKQLVQAPNAFAFYQTLNELSSNSSVFTDVQPGFIGGNIRNIEDSDEKVIGYFEVAQESEKRLFFNYEDFFPDEDLPPYIISCSFLSAPAAILPDGVSSPLLDAIDSGLLVYVRDNDGQVEDGGPFLTARRECGDCTSLGSNIVPEFWTEE
ncbi:MAG: DUF4249 domain-containing protein [Bacteroidota bacterium]